MDVARFRRVVRRQGDRFLDRVFTQAERASCAATARPILHLAARFAAKEAVFKALGGRGVSWLEIEVLRRPGHGVVPKLTGRTRALLGRGRLVVSITHTDRVAGAIAVSIRMARHGIGR